MMYTLASFLMPPLFVFGVYHLLTWFNFLRINERVFWKRVAITSGICHVALVTGFLVFSYLDAGDMAFGPYLFNRSNFWKLTAIFDTAPMVVIIVLLGMLDRAGMNPPGLVALILGIIYVIGTVQWFLVGGALGAVLERFFEGLKTPDPEEWD
jgi:hypothetical protein